MPHPTDTDYDHSARKRDANKREDEAVASSREALDKRLKKRAAEIDAEAGTHKVETRDGSYVHLKSPAFPTIAEAMARRQRDREHLAVRMMLAATVVALGYSLIFGGTFGYVAGGFFFVGAIVAAAVTSYRRNE